MARDQFRAVATPVDTVAVQTRTVEGPRPIAPVRELAPTMGALPAAPGRSDVSQLINALSGFSGSIQRLGDQSFQQYREKENLDAQMQAMRDNVSSWSQAVALDPTLADKSPFFRSVYESRMATNAVQLRAGQLMKDYYTSGLQSSEDPNAIQKWFGDKTKDLVDAAQTPGGKEATLEALTKVQKQFVEAHQKNALGNLLQKNEASVSSGVQTTMDNFAARGPAEPYKTADPVSTGLKPYETAFLNAIAGGESGGQYNRRYTPKGGADFELNAQHPQIKEPAGNGLTSDAAGRYQFLSSTWKDVMGNAAFTPENQDKAALLLARRDYKARTGEDLDKVLQTEGFSPRVQRALAPTWLALGGQQNRHLATFNASLKAAGGKPSGPFADSPNLPGLMGEIDVLKRTAQAQGMPPQQIDKTVRSAVINAAIKHEDEGLLTVLNVQQADGSPGLGMTVEGREAVEDGIKRIHALKTQRESHAYTMQQHEREQAKREFTGKVYEMWTAKMERGEPLDLPPALIAQAAKVDPDYAEKLINVRRTLEDSNKVEDTKAVGQLASDIYSGRGTIDDVMRGMAAGTLRDPGTIRDLLKEARRNQDSTIVSHPIYKDVSKDLERTVGDPFETGTLANPERNAQAQAAFRRSAIDFKEKNPKASDAEFNQFLTDTGFRIAQTYKQDSKLTEYEIGNVARKNEGGGSGAVTAPAAAPAASGGKGAQADPQPRANVEWRSVPLYTGSGRKALDAEFNAFIAGENNRFALWASKLGLKSKDEVVAFYNAQRGKLPEEK